MPRKLFCQLSPIAYNVSVMKERLIRDISDIPRSFCHTFDPSPLPVCVCSHKSLIRRVLGNTDMRLQENKAVNLSLAAPKINGILIRPGETFSFWHAVGSLTRKKGYLEGLAISNGRPVSGTGGGMCQMTNLIHWMVLHSDLTITEHHHHDGLDLFPDFGRQVPFGTGTSIFYNYLDYRVRNDTHTTYQILVHTSDTYLCGELRADRPLGLKYHIWSENEHFERQDGKLYRVGEVWRRAVDKRTGNAVKRELIKSNRALVMYDESFIDPEKIIDPPSSMPVSYIKIPVRTLK